MKGWVVTTTVSFSLMIFLDSAGYIFLCIKVKPRITSKKLHVELKMTMVSSSSTCGVTMAQNSRISTGRNFLISLVSPMSSLQHICHNRMGFWNARIGLSLRWDEPCSVNTIPQFISRLMLLTLRVILSTGFIFTNSSERLHMSSLPVKSQIFHILKSLVHHAGLEILLYTLSLHPKHTKVF